jgi:hypothetical protein
VGEEEELLCLSFSHTLAWFIHSLSLISAWFSSVQTSRVLSNPIRSGYSTPAASPTSESLDLDLDSYEMVQKYGAVFTTAADATVGDSESSALLAGDAVPSVRQREGRASMLSSVSNLTNTIMGSGEYFRSMYSFLELIGLCAGMLTFPLVGFWRPVWSLHVLI